MTRAVIPILILVIGIASGCVLSPLDATGRACDAAGACAAGFVCVEGACEQACATAEECPGQRRCIEGACLVVLDPDGEDEDGGVLDAGDPEPDPDGGPDDADAGVVDAGPNVAPVVNGGDIEVRTPADTAIEIGIDAVDANADDEANLVVVVVTPPRHGTASAVEPLAVLYQPADGFAGFDSVAVRVTDGELDSEVVQITIQVIGRSCAHVLNTGGSIGDGAYLADLTPDDDVADEDPVFCDMTSAAGGWTLALKIDGDEPTFCYDAPIWTDDNLLNPIEGVNATPAQEAKLLPYTLLPATELLVVLDEIADGAAPVRELVVPLSDGAAEFNVPLRQLIAFDGAQATELDDQDWERGLFPDDTSQIFDGIEGINVERGGATISGARIGQLGDTCCTESSTIGVGMRSNACVPGGIDLVTAGARLDPCCGGSPVGIAADARVSVRSRDFTFLPPAASCVAHQAAGRFLTGTYLVDPDGDGGAAGQPVPCALGDFRRVAFFERDGVPPDDACPAPWIENPDGPGCVRDRDGQAGEVVGAVAVRFESPVSFTTVKGRIEAIGKGPLDAFEAQGSGSVTIDNVFVDGVTVNVITGGAGARRHLFTFAAGTFNATGSECPCAGGAGAPSFVTTGTQLCEEVTPLVPAAFDEVQHLFDVQARDSACTQPETPNEFLVSLGATAAPEPGPLEVRLMLDDDDPDEDIAITRLELFVR